MTHRVWRSDRGATAVVVAIVLTVVGGFMALALNVGHMMAVRGELQNAADAAALAGAEDLSNLVSADGVVTAAGVSAAETTAVDYAGEHITDGANSVSITTSDVKFGDWNPAATGGTTVCGPSFTESSDLNVINAICVQTARSSTNGNPLAVYFSGVLSHGPTTDVRAAAVAAIGGRCNLPCPHMPITLLSCDVHCGDTFSSSWSQTTHGELTPNPGNNIAWTSFTYPSASACVFRTMIDAHGTCDNSTFTDCVGSPWSVQQTDCIYVQNGADNSALQDLVSKYGPTGPYYGEDFIVPIVCPTSAPTTDGGVTCGSSSGNAVATQVVLGFASAVITSVSAGSAKYINMTLTCGKDTEDPNSPGGCRNFRTIFPRPVLVQ